MTDPPSPRRIEETCLNAFPSLKQVLLGDWLFRFAGGVSRRANSANPLGSRCGDVAALIAAAEALYRTQDLPTIFRVPSIVDPALDSALTARSYRREGDSCVLWGPIADIAASPGPRVRLWPAPTPHG